MPTTTSPTESISTDRKAKLIESLDGLTAISKLRRLSPTEAVALTALETLHARCISRGAATIPHEAMRRPIAIAQQAMLRDMAPMVGGWLLH